MALEQSGRKASTHPGLGLGTARTVFTSNTSPTQPLAQNLPQTPAVHLFTEPPHTGNGSSNRTCGKSPSQRFPCHLLSPAQASPAKLQLQPRYHPLPYLSIHKWLSRYLAYHSSDFSSHLLPSLAIYQTNKRAHCQTVESSETILVLVERTCKHAVSQAHCPLCAPRLVSSSSRHLCLPNTMGLKMGESESHPLSCRLQMIKHQTNLFE